MELFGKDGHGKEFERIYLEFILYAIDVEILKTPLSETFNLFGPMDGSLDFVKKILQLINNNNPFALYIKWTYLALSSTSMCSITSHTTHVYIRVQC